MTEFIPSPDFVEKTMYIIRDADEKRGRIFKNQAAYLFATYAGTAGVILVGIANLIRLLATIYVPVACH